MCVVLVTQSCLTLCDPVDWGPPGFSIYGIFQARIQEWVAISFTNVHVVVRDHKERRDFPGDSVVKNLH